MHHNLLPPSLTTLKTVAAHHLNPPNRLDSQMTNSIGFSPFGSQVSSNTVPLSRHGCLDSVQSGFYLPLWRMHSQIAVVHIINYTGWHITNNYDDQMAWLDPHVYLILRFYWDAVQAVWLLKPCYDSVLPSTRHSSMFSSACFQAAVMLLEWPQIRDGITEAPLATLWPFYSTKYHCFYKHIN